MRFDRVYPGLALGGAMVLEQVPGDGTRWYAGLRDGKIVAFPATNPSAAPIIANLPSLTGGTGVNAGGEGGLLGMAFDPHFASTGRLYVSWTGTDTQACASSTCSMRSHVGFLTSSDGGVSFGSYTDILAFDQTDATNHKGGCARFGTDGFLYLSFGDGGLGDDAYLNGQTTTRFFSKILRIDVDHPSGGKPYGIPAGNPFATTGGDPEVFAYGFRNPFRFSIDRSTGDVWVGDVGQNQYEEIDRVLAGGNYGWPCREGFHDYYATDPLRCPHGTAGLADPVVEQQHMPPNSRAIIGGRVYRGRAVPDFVGSYVFADDSQMKVYTLTFDPTTSTPKVDELVGGPVAPWVDFAEDQDGEIYAVSLDDQIYRMGPDSSAEPSAVSTFPERLSQTGCFEPQDPARPTAGLVPYTVNAPLWSDGAEKRRWMALPDDATIVVLPDGDFSFPPGTVLVKEFSVDGKRIETRLLMHDDAGSWNGYSYRWLDDGSDALLLQSSSSRSLGAVDWFFPSRSDCPRCHTEAAGHTLGLELGQLNGDFAYPSNVVANQLATLEHIGMFSAPLGKPIDQIVAYPNPTGAAPAEGRARAYLHANCSNCHRSNGTMPEFDLRFGTALADTRACGAPPQQGDLDVPDAAIIAPGAPSRSVLTLRMHATPGARRMPPLASAVVDTEGAGVVDQWIAGLGACP